jgi:transcriptional regulator with XRE-family HTH domain
MKYRKTFGHNVRVLRTAKGFSQEAFAFACNFHRTYIGSVERGECNISVDNMERIAAALNVELPDLLRQDTIVIRSADGAHLLTGDIKRLARLLSQR